MKKPMLQTALRSDFRTFFKKAFATLHSGNMPEKARYIEVVCDFLDALDAGDFHRGVINLPPRHLKTFLCTVCLSAWTLGRNPASQIMIVSYGEELSRDIADKVRRILRSAWYIEAFSSRLSSDRYQVTDFATEQGGGVFATSFGAAITGRGADMIIVDDPVKIADAANIAVHDRAAEVFKNEIMNRLNRPKDGKILIVGHRLHPDDLSGRFASQPGWRHLAMPFVADKPISIKHGTKVWKRREGELLRPEGFTEDQVEEIRGMEGFPDFEILYQQNDAGLAGTHLTEDSFPEFSGPIPETCPLVLSIDPAQRVHRSASFSVIQAWGLIDDNLVLIDQWREHVDFDDLKVAAARFSNRHRPSVTLVEGASTGKALAEYLRRRNTGEVVEIDPGNRTKRQRLKSCVSRILSGTVLIKAYADFRDEFIEEFLNFPHGVSDDQVDATTQVLNYIATSPTIPSRQPRAICTVQKQIGAPPVGTAFTGVHPTGFPGRKEESGGPGIVAFGLGRRRW